MKNGSTVACLVKDFYPKEIDIRLEAPKTLVEFDPAIVVSPSGKYSAVKLGRYEDSNSVTCSVEHNNEIVSSTDFEPKKSPSGRSCLASRGWNCRDEALRERGSCKLLTDHCQYGITQETRLRPNEAHHWLGFELCIPKLEPEIKPSLFHPPPPSLLHQPLSTLYWWLSSY